MKKPPPPHPASPLARLALTALIAPAAALTAAPIPGLFNTGVDGEGNPLTPGSADPHYLVTASADPRFPGPDALTSASFPVPPWLAEGPDSRWVSPAGGAGNVAPGSYTFTTTFDLSGFDHTTARIEGRWSVDNSGVDIVFNGVGLFLTAAGFTQWEEFFIDDGFVAGENTLEFVVSNAGAGDNPGGLRVEMIGIVADPGAPPSFLLQPNSVADAVEGDTVTLRAIPDGDPPIAIQWQKDGEDLPGETGDTLTLAALAPEDAGDYVALATNANGTTASRVATVAVFRRIPGLFATGVDAGGQVLPDLEVDPHYAIVMNPDSESAEATVHDTLIWPIVDGPWLGPNDRSAWIAPRGDTVAAAGGDYHYELSFDLTGLDPATAFINGLWTSDNAGLDVLLNGTSTGVSQGGGFGAFSSFEISAAAGAPFIQGVNTLRFVVNNAGAGPTALRVEDIRGGALSGGGPGGAPLLLRQPEPEVFAFPDGTVQLSVLADGAQPLQFQWRRDGEDIPGEIGDTLFLFTGAPGVAGTYDVVVTNPLGTITSEAATVILLDLVPGLFNTGQAADGSLLAAPGVDPHYTLLENAHDPGLQEALVQENLPGAWVAPTATSTWIGPTSDTSAQPGTYTYRTGVDLTGFDPASAVLTGRLATDDGLVGIFVNGEPTSVAGGGGFTSLAAFTVAGGFGEGFNTIDFTLTNGGADLNPSGLHVTDLRLGAFRLPDAELPELALTALPGGGAQLSWPASAGDWTLARSTDLDEWTPVTEPPVAAGDELTLTVPTDEARAFFRLEAPLP